VGLAGDSEWALRFPSALAGAAAAAMLYLAGRGLERHLLAEPSENGGWSRHHPLSSILQPRCGTVAALLFATSPFALWYAQDAKVYSLLLLVIALELWALLRALRRPSPRAWLLLTGVVVVSLFVHRLALLAAAGAALACALTWPGHCQRST